jgi:DMSO/TMAO reductase YedYZ molybdopterin-dependent catalytic subunit
MAGRYLRCAGFRSCVLMPGRYGMKMPQWLTRLELVDKEDLGYWERQGSSNDGDRHAQAVIDDPHMMICTDAGDHWD